MTPKEKARELRDKMYLKIPSVYDTTGLPHYPIAKEMALIAIDEILNIEFRNFEMEICNELDYWNEVKLETNKL
jgi:hypothetical protein